MSPNSLANLRPRKKGDPPVPGCGAPKKHLSVTHFARETLKEIPKKLPNGKPNKQKKNWAQIVAENMVESACASPAVLHELMDRLEGKATQTIQANAEVKLVHDFTDEQLAAIAATSSSRADTQT